MSKKEHSFVIRLDDKRTLLFKGKRRSVEEVSKSRKGKILMKTLFDENEEYNLMLSYTKATLPYNKEEEFKEYYSHRYKIEAKNAELKNVYNYDKSNACGQSGITIQGAITLYLANLKRIYKLEDENTEKNTVK